VLPAVKQRNPKNVYSLPECDEANTRLVRADVKSTDHRLDEVLDGFEVTRSNTSRTIDDEYQVSAYS
jgi:hypothetical protein